MPFDSYPFEPEGREPPEYPTLRQAADGDVYRNVLGQALMIDIYRKVRGKQPDRVAMVRSIADLEVSPVECARISMRLSQDFAEEIDGMYRIPTRVWFENGDSEIVRVVAPDGERAARMAFDLARITFFCKHGKINGWPRPIAARSVTVRLGGKV